MEDAAVASRTVRVTTTVIPSLAVLDAPVLAARQGPSSRTWRSCAVSPVADGGLAERDRRPSVAAPYRSTRAIPGVLTVRITIGSVVSLRKAIVWRKRSPLATAASSPSGYFAR